MNGNNRKENIVRLSPEEHYVVHQLLVKMHPGNYKRWHGTQCRKKND